MEITIYTDDILCSEYSLKERKDILYALALLDKIRRMRSIINFARIRK